MTTADSASRLTAWWWSIRCNYKTLYKVGIIHLWILAEYDVQLQVVDRGRGGFVPVPGNGSRLEGV